MAKLKTPVKFENLPIIGDQPASEQEEKYLREVIKVEFYNLEQPGLTQQFTYGNSNAMEKFVFFHGGKYEVPRHVSRWVESRGTPLYGWIPDGKGSLKKEFKGWNPRFSMRMIH